jgi:hypothetical protein
LTDYHFMDERKVVGEYRSAFDALAGTSLSPAKTADHLAALTDRTPGVRPALRPDS